MTRYENVCFFLPENLLRVKFDKCFDVRLRSSFQLFMNIYNALVKQYVKQKYQSKIFKQFNNCNSFLEITSITFFFC